MNEKFNNKGFTLLEVLAVFILLSIFLTFMVPRVLLTISNAKVAADQADLEVLNRATAQYCYFLEIECLSLPENLTQDELLSEGFIVEILEPRQNDMKYEWKSSEKCWILSQE